MSAHNEAQRAVLRPKERRVEGRQTVASGGVQNAGRTTTSPSKGTFHFLSELHGGWRGTTGIESAHWNSQPLLPLFPRSSKQSKSCRVVCADQTGIVAVPVNAGEKEAVTMVVTSISFQASPPLHADTGPTLTVIAFQAHGGHSRRGHQAAEKDVESGSGGVDMQSSQYLSQPRRTHLFFEALRDNDASMGMGQGQR